VHDGDGGIVREAPAPVPPIERVEASDVRKKVHLVLGLAGLAVVATACAPNASQDSLNPQGPYARIADDLFIPVFWIAAAVFFIVEGLILFFLIRYRHRKGRDRLPPQIHGNTRLEIGWTILPALVLVGVAVPTVTTIFELAGKPSGDVLNVTVQGHQWWWGFEYTDPELSPAPTAEDPPPLVTANELVIPAGRPVYLSLESIGGLIGGTPWQRDNAVIHSFWPPELAGKQDVIPSQENHMTIQADGPGVYEGQCLEYCGLSHALMRFQVVAMTESDFDAWVSDQQQDALTPEKGSLAAQGMKLFDGGLPTERGGQCIECHAVQGITNEAPLAGNNAGPNLTHFASRDCFAGCTLDNHSADDIEAWLRDPASQKFGSKMPNYHLIDEEIDALVAYLQSLE
jgi:cytochrome c oxidase subunit II